MKVEAVKAFLDHMGKQNITEHSEFTLRVADELVILSPLDNTFNLNSKHDFLWVSNVDGSIEMYDCESISSMSLIV